MRISDMGRTEDLDRNKAIQIPQGKTVACPMSEPMRIDCGVCRRRPADVLWKYTEKEKPRKRANAISPASGVSVMKIYQQYCMMDLYARLYQLL